MRRSLRILLVGSWTWPWYQAACARALTALGCTVVPFEWFSDFRMWRMGKTEPDHRSFLARVQDRLLLGPLLSRINHRLRHVACHEAPDVIWLYNSTHIFASTIRKLKDQLPHTLLVQYANDNPFGAHVKPDYWRHLKRAIPVFDLHFVYRESNRQDFYRAGAKNVHLLRSYYIPEDDYREVPLHGDRFTCDIVFAGHYEQDGRWEALEALACAGHKTNVFGGGWAEVNARLSRGHPLYGQGPIVPVLGSEYRRAISGAKIALCFLSKVNHDSYTRRNFQIPAMQTFMLSEYSDDLASLFREGVDAEFFRSREELMEKARFYLSHERLRERIALNGYHRVLRDGHDVQSRMTYFLATITSAGEHKHGV